MLLDLGVDGGLAPCTLCVTQLGKSEGAANGTIAIEPLLEPRLVHHLDAFFCGVLALLGPRLARHEDGHLLRDGLRHVAAGRADLVLHVIARTREGAGDTEDVSRDLLRRFLACVCVCVWSLE